jgi:bifunctional UDP-N-acetylglucosamine pyrophosphorylase/glucosamine-1-phosphate N-acetyltransferase
MRNLAAVVLAAGKGTRMKSALPKALHLVAGKAMLQHVVDTLSGLKIKPVHIVVGHGAQMVEEQIKGDIRWILQAEQKGTGHALAQVGASLEGFSGDVLVTCVDTPLFTPASLQALLDAHAQEGYSATVVTAKVGNPFGYGRIVRNCQGSVVAIVEEKDAREEERRIDEVNSGTYCFSWPQVALALQEIKPSNAQGEYYLTDIISLLAGRGEPVGTWVLPDPAEMMGVNDRVQLAEAEGYYRARRIRELQLAGVTIKDPHSVWIEADVLVAQDTVILPNTSLEGSTVIGENCVIGPQVTIRDCRVQSGTTIQNSVLLQSEIGSGVNVGPYAYIRPGCKVGDGVKIGDFVELKNTHLGSGSKVPHLAYVGDARVGEDSNIGCGVITANYDGNNKHITQIGSRVFVGSNVTLVAPVHLEDDSFAAAGSTITQDVPAQGLAIARCRQTVKENWRKKN